MWGGGRAERNENPASDIRNWTEKEDKMEIGGKKTRHAIQEEGSGKGGTDGGVKS